MLEKSPVVKRSVVVGGHKTSISIEDDFWLGLKEIAFERRQTLSQLVNGIDLQRDRGNLSSAIRLFVLGHYRDLVRSAQTFNFSTNQGASEARETRAEPSPNNASERDGSF